MSLPRIELVVTRFQEDLSWIKELPDMFGKILIYNKGNPTDFNIPKSEVHMLPNLGMDAYVNLYHVINNYNNLADVTVFALGSTWSCNNKTYRLIKTLSILRKKTESVLYGVFTDFDHIKETYFFNIDQYEPINKENKVLDSKLNVCQNRPLGKWFINHFPNEMITAVSYKGIFAVSRSDIQKRPIEFYKKLLQDVSYPAPEAAHYLERTWKNVFSIPDECCITDTDITICFITAIYGNYEASCKPYVNQYFKTDFICFTDNPNIISNGWIIDTTPYHYLNKSPLNDSTQVNSLYNNKHTFNIAKYYKQAFQNIPRLKKYDVVVWLDGTLEITHEQTSSYILKNIFRDKIITWHHEHRFGELSKEVIASNMIRYTSTHWNGQNQPYQDVNKQYEEYLKNGYTDEFFKRIPSHTPHFGVWLTCFVAFLNIDESVSRFLDLWYLQTLTYTTQDQIGFPYVCQKTGLIPCTLPNNEIKGDSPHSQTQFYIKHNHGL